MVGNIHVAPGKSMQINDVHIHDVDSADVSRIHSTHTIHTLSFGDTYPGLVNALDGTHWPIEHGAAVHNYYVKIVPTVLE